MWSLVSCLRWVSLKRSISNLYLKEKKWISFIFQVILLEFRGWFWCYSLWWEDNIYGWGYNAFDSKRQVIVISRLNIVYCCNSLFLIGTWIDLFDSLSIGKTAAEVCHEGSSIVCTFGISVVGFHKYFGCMITCTFDTPWMVTVVCQLVAITLTIVALGGGLIFESILVIFMYVKGLG